MKLTVKIILSFYLSANVLAMEEPEKQEEDLAQSISSSSDRNESKISGDMQESSQAADPACSASTSSDRNEESKIAGNIEEGIVQLEEIMGPELMSAKLFFDDPPSNSHDKFRRRRKSKNAKKANPKIELEYREYLKRKIKEVYESGDPLDKALIKNEIQLYNDEKKEVRQIKRIEKMLDKESKHSDIKNCLMTSTVALATIVILVISNVVLNYT